MSWGAWVAECSGFWLNGFHFLIGKFWANGAAGKNLRIRAPQVVSIKRHDVFKLAIVPSLNRDGECVAQGWNGQHHGLQFGERGLNAGFAGEYG